MRNITIILFFLFSSINYSQESSDILVRVVDAETEEAISFVTIRIKDSNNGLIADYFGEFRLPMTEEIKGKTLILSSIGYKTAQVLVADFVKEKVNVVRLNTQLELLDPVVLVGNRPRPSTEAIKQKSAGIQKMLPAEIVREAINKIPEHLDANPHSYIGYYRDYQMVDAQYHNLNEGILEMFDQGIESNFLAEGMGQTAVYRFKQNENFIQDSHLTSAYNGETKYIKGAEILSRGGNEYRILVSHNPVRSFNVNTFSYVYNLEEDFMNNHDFSKDQITYLDNEPIYIIKFQKLTSTSWSDQVNGPKINKYKVRGSIYISMVDFAIHQFNYKMFEPGAKEPLFSVGIEYSRLDNHMFLNYITFNNAFEIADDFILKDKEVAFIPEENAFHITFNRSLKMLDHETLKKKNFKFKYDNKRLKILRIDTSDRNKLIVFMKPTNLALLNSSGVNPDPNLFDVSIKKIRDIFDYELYEPKTIEGNQFREFFVQSVKRDRVIPKNLKLMNLNIPIADSELNTNREMEQYWVNSPLKN